MTYFMLYGKVQSGIRSRDGKCMLKVDILFPEILLLTQNTSLTALDINSFLSFFFFKPVSRLLYISKS